MGKGTEPDPLMVVSASSLAETFADARVRQFLGTLLDNWPSLGEDSREEALTAFLGMASPAAITLVRASARRKGELSATSGVTASEIRSLVEDINRQRLRILGHRNAEPPAEGSAGWKAVARFLSAVSGLDLDLVSASGHPTRARLASDLSACHLQSLKDRHMNFTWASFGWDDTLAAITTEVSRRHELKEHAHQWKPMRKAWHAYCGTNPHAHGTTMHNHACLEAARLLLEVVEDDPTPEQLAEACAAWVEVNLTAAKGAGGASTWQQQRGWLCSKGAQDRFVAFLKGLPAEKPNREKLESKLNSFL